MAFVLCARIYTQRPSSTLRIYLLAARKRQKSRGAEAPRRRLDEQRYSSGELYTPLWKTLERIPDDLECAVVVLVVIVAVESVFFFLIFPLNALVFDFETRARDFISESRMRLMLLIYQCKVLNDD